MSRIIICGSRTFMDYDFLCKIVDGVIVNYPEPEIVSGGSIGADSLAERYAQEHFLKNTVFKADWDLHGMIAGLYRTTAMHEYIALVPNRLCIAFWDGESPGTQHNFDLAKKHETNLLLYNRKLNKLTYNFAKQGIKKDFYIKDALK